MSGYDASDWKPGDVALVSGMRAMYGGQRNAFPCWQFADGSRCRADALPVPLDRRLVVIDPDDITSVRRLWDLYFEAVTEDSVDSLQVALREFANPTPRIEEPQGLGAVVADTAPTNGERLYVRARSATTSRHWHPADGNGDPRTWAELSAAVRVLSEGVTP